MRIIFFGTSIFAIPSLKALAASGHKMVLVVTQPDRKKGRHLKIAQPATKEIASSLGIPVYQPIDASSKEAIANLKKYDADLFIVVSFGQILSQEVLDIPKKFAINLHASLLPKYRGAAPINWAIMNDEKTTGVSVFKLAEKMDAGDIILDEKVKIDPEDDALALGERLARVGAEILVNAVNLIDKENAVFKKQDEALATFAPKLKKEDGLIDWSLSALDLHNKVRGLAPWPGAFTDFKDQRLKILKTQTAAREGAAARPGEIIAIKPGLGVLVKTGEGCLAIQRLQLEGSKPMGVEEFLRGHRLQAGDILI